MRTLQLNQYEAFIFDFDNTIMASEKHHYDAMGLAANELLGGYKLTAEDIKDYNGNTSDWIANKIIHESGHTEVTVKQLSDRKAFYIKQTFTPEPFPGATEFLQRFAPIRKMAIGSNSPCEFIHDAVKLAGYDGIFDQILTIEDVHERKPNPEIFLLCAQRLNVPVEKCLVFEDSKLGLGAGVNGGFDTVMMVNPGDTIPDVIPDQVFIHTWKQLLQMPY